MEDKKKILIVGDPNIGKTTVAEQIAKSDNVIVNKVDDKIPTDLYSSSLDFKLTSNILDWSESLMKESYNEQFKNYFNQDKHNKTCKKNKLKRKKRIKGSKKN